MDDSIKLAEAADRHFKANTTKLKINGKTNQLDHDARCSDTAQRAASMPRSHSAHHCAEWRRGSAPAAASAAAAAWSATARWHVHAWHAFAATESAASESHWTLRERPVSPRV